MKYCSDNADSNSIELRGLQKTFFIDVRKRYTVHKGLKSFLNKKCPKFLKATPRILEDF